MVDRSLAVCVYAECVCDCTERCCWSGLCLGAQGGVRRDQVEVFADRRGAFEIPDMASKHAVEDNVGFWSLRKDKPEPRQRDSTVHAQPNGKCMDNLPPPRNSPV